MTARALDTQTILVETAQYSIHRIETAEHGTVIVKASRSTQPTRKEISQLENEFRILKSIESVDGVPRALALEVESHRAHLMLEDFGGLSLTHYAGNRAIRLDQFFKIAKQIARIVGAIHAHNIVHCDLKPNNVLINPETMEIQIIDFGCSRHLIGRGQFQNDGQGMTLAYIAPEQTGRVNRRIDHRTDFYSLGITFYELLAGKLPFHGTDALEWVHAHIAKKARPLHEVDHHITPAVSQIVERLMNKAPEERYQTPEGLLYDLELAETYFNERKLWDTIKVGERDRSTKVFLSQKIVGRERELQSLNEDYMKSQIDGLRFVTVHGEAGVGKSALAREFRRLYADQIALFGFGKADPRQSVFPFSSFASVAEDLVKQILNAPEHLKTEFVTNLELKLQRGLGALLVIAPSLKDLICAVEKVDEATDSIGRLYVTIAAFFETMAEVFGQVVIQLDDANAIDEASAKAVAWLVQNMSSLHLLIVLSYRKSTLEESLYLGGLLKILEENPERGSDLPLNDLHLEDVSLFLKDTLQDSKETSQELSDLLLQKSGGNPFFMGQVLKSWLDDQLLFHDPYQGWSWNAPAIEAKEIAKSVLDLLGSKIQALPKNVRYLFTMASCFPKNFSSQDLSDLTGVDEAGIARSTRAVIEAGLVIPESETVFRFAHEQIREAFYSLLNIDSRRDLHAHVGLRLLSVINFDKVSNDELYLTAEHLNVGISKVQDATARLRMAELNLRVAQLARDATAYDLALKFAKAGIDAGDALTWDEANGRLFKLYSVKGECEYLTGDLALAQATFAVIRKNASTRNDQLAASLQLIRLLQTSGRTLEAMTDGLSVLEEFGIKIDRIPWAIKLAFGLARAAYDLRGDRTRAIPVLNGTSEEDEFRRLRHELLVVVSTAAYFIDKKVLLNVCLTGYRLGMTEGMSGEISNHFLLVGMVLAGRFGRYAQVERNCVNTIDRVREFIKPQAALLMQFNRQAFILPWLSAWSKAVPAFDNLKDEALKSGEPFTAALASLYVPYYKMYQGYDIIETEETLSHREYLAKHDHMLYDCALPGYGFRALLRGETASESDFSHPGFDEQEYLERIAASTTPNPKAWFDAHKMMALFMFGDYKGALGLFAGARRYMDLTPFSITNVLIRSFGIMVACENALDGSKMTLFLARRVRLARRQLKMWARLNPIDVEPYYFLVEAELASLKGRQLEAMQLFEKAAQAALKTKSWMIAGIIYERTARFNVRHDRVRLARAHAEEAAYCFERWGAAAKVAQVRKLYGLTSSRQSISSDSRASSSSDSRKLSAQIDLESLMKSTRALSSELDLTVLSVKLTEVIMESAGASRAVLLMPTASGFVVKSEAGETHQGFPDLVAASGLALEPIVVADTGQSDSTKNDRYFEGRKAMSALAIPIAQKRSLQAVVYLENESATNVFTSSQLEVLKVLLSQAGVALENARLYSEVSEKARMAGELQTAQAVQKTLFPVPQLKLPDVAVTGFYEPASECGGDWWFYHEQGDKLFLYIGDATGHGASAALVTSAARSAVSLLSLDDALTPQSAMSRLNRAIYETSKGTMNMTFFIGAYDRKSGRFDYCNASHEPPFWIKKEVTDRLKTSGLTDAQQFQEFKAGLGSLDDVHGPRLGEAIGSQYRESTVTMAPDDLVVLFTDGVADARNSERQEWGQRRFLKALQKATQVSHDLDHVVQKVVAENKAFTGTTPLDDDIMVVACKGLKLVS